MWVRFEVPFVCGKARPRLGRGGRVFTPQKTVRAERAVRSAFMEACSASYGDVVAAPRGTPVRVEVRCETPLPKGERKSTLFRPYVVRPDGDNVLKLVLDALNGIAWADDAQVDEMLVSKMPRTRESAERTVVTVSWGA